MRRIGHVDHRLRVLMFPSPVPSPQNCKENDRQRQHKQEDKNHKTPNPPPLLQTGTLAVTGSTMHVASHSLDANPAR